MLNFLGGAGNLIAVILGFGAVIFIHELGHFLAAKWAGIRVHEFAIGFGPPALSYRKGIGLRIGSTEPDVRKLHARVNPSLAVGPKDEIHLPPGVSPTEYRLNWLPLGGYVKMLGQEDFDPAATSNAPDSYAAQPVWKRLIVVSAGVFMNVILAAALFVVVFMAGLPAPPSVVGEVLSGSPAATAVATNAEALGVTEKGLQPGDYIARIGDEEAQSFKDVAAYVGLAKKGRPVPLIVERPGVRSPLRFDIEPTTSDRTRLLELGVAPPWSTRLADLEAFPNDEVRARYTAMLDEFGLEGVRPGMTLTRVAGEPVDYLHDLTRALRESKGEPVSATFRADDGSTVDVRITPRALLQTDLVTIGAGKKASKMSVTHLLGLSPPMTVTAPDRAQRFGLEEGDVLARIGQVEWPNVAQGVAEIRRHTGGAIRLTVLRDGQYVDVEATVAGGRIGFGVGDASDGATIVTRPPGAGAGRPADALGLAPGSSILQVAGAPVRNYTELRAALRRATADARASAAGATVPLVVRLPIGEGYGAGPTENVAWELSPADVETLHALGWDSPLPPTIFMPAEILLKASDPAEALANGHSETKRVIVMTYVTLVRLFEGSVRVEHLKGPVGIAHIGTQFIDRGVIHLLFFLAIISANLAVLNFLPLPIVDGGHVVFLLIEGLTKRPVSVGVQNAATLLGVLLLGALFVVVTFNDITAIFTG